jgi:hypothetical protein
MTELNDLKKMLYKENPFAIFRRANKTGLLYTADLVDKTIDIRFIIPFDEIGDADFGHTMPAKHLIRWILPLTE